MPDILVAEKVDNSASGNFINNAIVITTKGKVCEPCLCQPVGLSASECHDDDTDAVDRIQKTALCCEPDLSLEQASPPIVYGQHKLEIHIWLGV